MRITEMINLTELHSVGLQIYYQKQICAWSAKLIGPLRIKIDDFAPHGLVANGNTSDEALDGLVKMIAGRHLESGGYSYDIPADLTG